MPEPVAKTAIITGGGQGIGKGLASHFLRLGMQVALAEVDREAGEETAQELSALGPVRFFPTNVADETAVRRRVESTLQAFGRLDALINNAGLAHPYTGPVEELSLADWQQYLDVNLTGYFLCAKHAIPHLRRTRGSIVNIASTRALQSEPHTEAYAAAKGGIAALTHALAISLGPAVRVNAISPGWISVSEWQKRSNRATPDLRPSDHEQHPAGRVGKPEDIAHLAAFLISDQAEFITGQNFVADGGMTRKMIYQE